jgi:Sugar (and other) transporter
LARETFQRHESGKSESVPLRPYLSVAVLALLLLASGTVGTYVRTYMTTYAIATLHMAANVAFAATIILGVSGIVVCLAGGLLSDRFGRKPVMVIFATLSLLSIIPAFRAILHYRSASTLLCWLQCLNFGRDLDRSADHLARRIFASADPRQRVVYRLCRGDFGFRRHNAVHRHLDHEGEFQSACTCLLLDRRL